jgi:hypothetical protein
VANLSVWPDTTLVAGVAMTEPRWWAVIAIDWDRPNVVAWWAEEQGAKDMAEGLDRLALRCIVVPEGDPMIMDTRDHP